MNKRLWAGIAIIILLIIIWLFFFFQPQDLSTDPSWRSLGSPSESLTKIHEEQFSIRHVTWEDCCDGEVRVEFEHMWEFYFDEWHPEDDCCHNPVTWTIKDSTGQEVYSSESCSPVDTFNDPETITGGVWDCVRPWTVTVVNGCLYPINYKWELTMYCYE